MNYQAIIRSFRSHQLPAGVLIISPSSSSSKQVRRGGRFPSSTGVSLRKVKTFCSHPESKQQNMEKAQQPKDEKGDVMSHSFGEGYATRSDDEGFGGVYGGNDQTDHNVKLDNKIHENHPAYDKSQGSGVKQKEKARNQTNAED